MSRQPIYVTRPYLPPLDEFMPYLRSVWENKWLTNNGPFHQELEKSLSSHLGVQYLSLLTNGTIALVTALQTLRITGEVITTPYSFVATAHSLLWNNIKPVFVDIDPVTMNLDPTKIEAAITPDTSAILAVHCYGIPCDVERIQSIADIHGLRVIYDAAPAFGVRYKGRPLVDQGDLSVLSFHATKVFTTCEGGAIISRDAETKQRVDFLKNFGFADEVTVVAPGINGKMNEVQAGLGLLQLKYVDSAIESRRKIAHRYRRAFSTIPGINPVQEPANTDWNYAYFPILVEGEYPLARDKLYDVLRSQGIYARRYYYPLISSFPMYRSLPSAAKGNLGVADAVAEKVLCLPIYPGLAEEEQESIIQAIARPN